MRAYLDGNTTCVFQWDNNRRLILDGYPVGVVVAYSNICGERAPVVESYTKNGVQYANIPPEIMQEPHCIGVDIRLDGNTLHKTFITLVPGKKPDDYVMEPVEILRYETLAKRVKALEEGGMGGVGLDTTLTQSGKAADAKATGDEIKRVEGLIPSIEGLAKAEDIPKNPEDIGAQPAGNYLTKAPVSSVNGKTGAVQLKAADVGADPKGTASAAVAAHNTNSAAHPDLQEEMKRIEGEIPDVSAFITKAVSDLVNYYAKSETYTREEIKSLVSAVPKFAIKVVTALPTTGISETTIYLVPAASETDLYSEYIYVDGAWEILGAQRVDLTGYATEAWVKAGYQPKGDYLTEHQSLAHLLPRTELASAINTALGQARDSGEFDGEDGVSPTVAVSTITGGHRVTITDKNGTKTVDVLDGSKGNDGRGIKSITRTSGNGAAGTVDTYTITYTDGTTGTYQVRNGANGTDGDDGITPRIGSNGNWYIGTTDTGVKAQGADGSPGTAASFEITGVTALAHGEAPTVTEADGSTAQARKYVLGIPAGAPGATPVKGVDYYTAEDKAEIVADVLEALSGQVIPGYKDEDNNIYISTLAEGTYTIKYIQEDGTVVDVATLEAGDTRPAYTNLADPASADWLTNKRLGSSGLSDEASGSNVTNYIPCKKDDVVRVKGLNIAWLASEAIARMHFCDANKTILGTINPAEYEKFGFGLVDINGQGTGYDAAYDWTYHKVGIADGDTYQTYADSIAYIRFCGKLESTAANVIITANEEII